MIKQLGGKLLSKKVPLLGLDRYTGEGEVERLSNIIIVTEHCSSSSARNRPLLPSLLFSSRVPLLALGSLLQFFSSNPPLPAGC
jgi:hypothetical protein